jgi:hypothetical protein
MANCGNFLEYAGSKCGLDVGYGKMLLVYGTKVSKSAANLTAAAIQAEITAGTIIGIIKGWHTIAGASVAEINVERTGTAEMKLIRSEIAADTLTFENSIVNNEILNDAVKAGSLNCILIDDQGNAFGDYSEYAGQISSMLCNFSGKTTSSFQKDNVTEKTVAVTVRYLVEDVNVLQAGTETELIISKDLLTIQTVGVSVRTASDITIVLSLKDKATGKAMLGDVLLNDIELKSDVAAILDDVIYDEQTGECQIVLTGTAMPTTGDLTMFVTLSGSDYYTKETKVIVSEL